MNVDAKKADSAKAELEMEEQKTGAKSSTHVLVLVEKRNVASGKRRCLENDKAATEFAKTYGLIGPRVKQLEYCQRKGKWFKNFE